MHHQRACLSSPSGHEIKRVSRSSRDSTCWSTSTSKLKQGVLYGSQTIFRDRSTCASFHLIRPLLRCFAGPRHAIGRLSHRPRVKRVSDPVVLASDAKTWHARGETSNIKRLGPYSSHCTRCQGFTTGISPKIFTEIPFWQGYIRFMRTNLDNPDRGR